MVTVRVTVMKTTGGDPTRRAMRRLLEEVFKRYPELAEQKERPRPRRVRRVAEAWWICCCLVLLLALFELASTASGYLPASHQSLLKVLVALGASGILIVFPDCVAD
jgi:hypothetical protein